MLAALYVWVGLRAGFFSSFEGSEHSMLLLLYMIQDNQKLLSGLRIGIAEIAAHLLLQGLILDVRMLKRKVVCKGGIWLQAMPGSIS
ncbi:hypothetical protein GOP47_0022442 [Adiantum capillus-veneris]|uniref:Uncharacterized protein n=1 Tax=Adiantum capillus-veneris TaxID=13818 RepID=A0A9D4U5K5_ADICA|nr:hypothetical protein GOP47_0022442 [Adiantum capillus-veneris]